MTVKVECYKLVEGKRFLNGYLTIIKLGNRIYYIARGKRGTLKKKLSKPIIKYLLYHTTLNPTSHREILRRFPKSEKIINLMYEV